MNQYNVLIQNGYCEDARNSWLWMNFYSEKQCTNKQIFLELKKAMMKCAKVRADGAMNIHQRRHSECPPYPHGPKRALFCPSCGVGLPKKETTEAELASHAAELLRDIQNYTCDGIRQEWVGILDEHGWVIWGVPVNGRMVFLSAPDRGIEGEENFPEIESKRVTFK